jgi:large subunit ribosomal protein L18
VSLQKKIKLRAQRRAFRVKNRLESWGQKPRVSVFRSLKHIYAQIIDDSGHVTLASFSSLSLKDNEGDKKAIAKKVGIELGKLAASKAIKDVFFDRGRYLYHGRVRALADGLREGGLNF